MVLIFAVAIFVASTLLFLIQPMIAKMMLPLFGGASSVWLASMVFFQAALLVGYSYSNWSIRRFGPRKQSLIHVGILLLPLPLLPMTLPDWRMPVGAGSGWVILVLTVTVGLPFFVVSASSPLLQRWFGTAGHPRSRNPYFLYAIGNVGSLVGLLSYPLFVEARLSLPQQARLWTAGYLVLVALALICVRLLMKAEKTNEPINQPNGAPALPPFLKLRWIAYAFVPSGLLLASTHFITAEVGAIPLLWTIPLSVYLITFVIAFRSRASTFGPLASRLLAVMSLVVFLTWAIRAHGPLWLLVGIHSVFLLIAGVVGHSRLYESRPEADHLTTFYVCLSLGGVLGGAFVALLAPILFDSPFDYSLLVIGALLLRKSTKGRTLRLLQRFAPALIAPVVAVGVSRLTAGNDLWIVLAGLSVPALIILSTHDHRVFAIGMVLLLLAVPPFDSNSIWSERNFYGTIRVQETRDERVLYHGMTLHGLQYLDDRRYQPTSYYNANGPLGDVFELADGPMRTGIVGLGAGTVAAYGRSGMSMTFYEIDPAIAGIASPGGIFTFIADSEARVSVLVGDGRSLLAAEPDGSIDLLILDAFSADAIPVHLLTTEAFEMYLSKLSTGALIAINISNRYFDLEPMLALEADYLGLEAIQKKLSGAWVVMGAPSDVNPLRSQYGWSPLSYTPGLRMWSDEYSYQLAVLRR